jgi:cell division protein FtsQ
MTDQVDPRLARRRRQVQEASAQRRLRWLIAALLLAVSAGLVVAVFQSSWFSVDTISVEGQVRTPVLELLEEAGITEGVSIVSVRTAGAVERLRSDPWVAEAEVRAVWPRTVEVIVVEHIPIARVKSGPSWVISSSQGVVVAGEEPIVEPVIELDSGRFSPGMQIEDEAVLGALQFVAALPLELKPELVVAREGADLVATVLGFRVELGLPKDMAQKAVTLAVLFDKGVESGAVINVISPLRPAVSNPQPPVEGSQEVTTETTASS